MHQENYRKKQECCLICFTPFSNYVSICNTFSINKIICDKCLKKFNKINKHELIAKVDTWFLYSYNSFAKSLLYKYKGCYDVVLKDAFLNEYKSLIKRKYKNHIIVFPPSNKQDDINRGFTHIEKIIDCLNMKHENLFYKEIDYKQSSMHYTKRYLIKNIIKMKDIKIDVNAKYLIVDDIFTSGSTLKTIISLINKKGVKKENIKALIIFKVADFVEL